MPARRLIEAVDQAGLVLDRTAVGGEAKGVEVERLAARENAMGDHDLLAGREKVADQARRIVDKVDIEPEHPVLVAESIGEKPVSRAGEHGAARPLRLA